MTASLELAPIRRAWGSDYLDLPRDFLLAVGLAGLDPDQTLALMVAIQLGTPRGWKRSDPEPFRPDWPAVAAELGVSAPSLMASFRALEARGILASSSGGLRADWQIVADWRCWCRRGGKPMFDARQTRAILSVITARQRPLAVPRKPRPKPLE